MPNAGDSLIPETLIATRGTLDAIGATDQDVAMEALALADDVKSDFTARDELYKNIEMAIFLANDVYIPKAYRKSGVIETRSPLPPHTVHTIAAALSMNPASVHFNSEPVGDAGRENKELRQQFLEAAWLQQEREASRQILRLFIYAVVAYGEGVIKTVERKNRAWSGYDAYAKRTMAELKADDSLDDDHRERIYDAKTEDYKRGCAYPIASTDVLPQTFYYVKGEDGFTTCIEDKLVPYYDTLERYDAALDQNGKVVAKKDKNGELTGFGLPTHQWHEVMGKSRMVRMVEVWRWDRCLTLLCGPGDLARKGSKSQGGGMLVKQVEHGYGDPELKTLRGPYFHAYGTTTNSREPGKAGLSMLFGYLDLYRLLDSLLTIQSQAANMFGFPAWRRLSQPGAGIPDDPFGKDAGTLASGEAKPIEPGDVIPYDIAPLEPPRGSDALDRSIANIRGMLDMALPPVVQGMNADAAGVAINQAAHLARLAWDPAVKNIEFALGNRVGFESWMLDACVGERVYVQGLEPAQRRARSRGSEAGVLGIGPKDLDGRHSYRVTLQPEMPQNQVVETRMHREKLDLGLETEAQAIEATGGNPTEVERGRLLERFKKKPEVEELIWARVRNRIATLDQQAMDESGAPAPGGPPGGGAAPQGDLIINQGGPEPGGAPPMAPPPNGQPGPAAVQGGAPGQVQNLQMPANYESGPGQGVG